MKYELTNGYYQIAEFTEVYKECEEFIEREGNLKLVITNDADKREAKASRTAIRKKKEQIAAMRKSLNGIVMGIFNSQVKELEKMLEDADEQLKDKITAYENAGKPETPPVFTIVISSFDEKAIEEVKAYALKLGCGVK